MKQLIKFFNKNKKAIIKCMTMLLVGTLFAEYANAADSNDILASGDDMVKATIGQDSKLVTWLYIGEVVLGAAMYLKSKNPYVLFGFAFVIVMTKIGFTVAAGN